MGSGFKDFAVGAILPASDVDGYLMRQTVMTFATAAARDSALSGVLDEGMVTYLEDTPNRLTYYDGSAWQTMLSEWTTWSPTYGNLTVGNGTTAANYAYTGMKTVTATWRFVFGSSSAMGTGPTVTLPVAPATSLEIEATRATLQDSSGSRYYGALSSSGGSTVQILSEQVSGTAIVAATTTSTVPFTWASGDYLIFTITYGV